MIGELIFHIAELVVDFVLELLVHGLGWFIYHTGMLALKITGYDIGKISDYSFWDREVPDGEEKISYRIPLKIGIALWILILVSIYILLVWL